MTATFTQWGKGPDTRFSAMRPFSIGFTFESLTRLDRLEVEIPSDAYYERAQAVIEIGAGRGWKRLPDDFHLDVRFPEVYRLRGIHRFAPVATRRIRFVLLDSYRQHYAAFAIAVFEGNRVVARHDPLAGTPYFEFRKTAFGSFTDDAVAAVEKADAPDRYDNEIRRQRKHLWNRRDTLGNAILRQGEPTEERVRFYFPPIRFASTVIGHPGHAPANLRVDWNGTLLFDPYRGAYGPETPDRLHNCAGFYFRKTLAFAVGPERVRFGRNRDRLRPLALDRGCRPRVTAAYREAGVEYRLELFSLRTGNRVEAWLAFRAVNRSAVRRSAWLGLECRNFLMHEKPRTIALLDSRTIREGDRDVLVSSRPLEQEGALFFCRGDVNPGAELALYARINPSWYETPASLSKTISEAAYRNARRRFDALWDGLFRRCATVRTPDRRFEHGFYAGIAGLLLFSDAERRFVYYGSMSTYDRTLYYLESPHAPLALGLVGLGRESRDLTMGLFEVMGRLDKSYFQYLPLRHFMAGYAWRNYLVNRDKAWLRRFVQRMRPYMDEYVALLDGSPMGILPPSGFGGDIQDRKVYSINSDLTGCFGLLAYAAMLTELGDPQAASYTARSKTYWKRVMDLLEQTEANTEWGEKAYSLILDDDGGNAFYYESKLTGNVVDAAKTRPGVGAHRFYFDSVLKPVFLNNFSYYLAIFSSVLLGTSLLNRFPRQRRRVAAFLERGGGVFGGLPRGKGLDINPTYWYGYRRTCLEDGGKGRFLLAAFSDLYGATSDLFQTAESFRIVPDPRWGVVENKRTVGVSENFVGRIRSDLDMFFLEEFDGPRSTGRVRIAAGIPDAWWASGRSFGVRGARFSGGRIDVWIGPAGAGRTQIEVRCPELDRDLEFVVARPGPAGARARVIEPPAGATVRGGDVTIRARRAFRLVLGRGSD